MDYINDDNFKREIEKFEKPIILDFHAKWCPPCREMAPAIEKVAEEMKNDFVLLKIDIDELPKTASSFGVTGVPYVALLKNGEIVDSFLGSKEKHYIRDWLKRNIKEEGAENNVRDNLISEYEEHANNNGFRLNPDKETVRRIAEGILRNKELHGNHYCPCRRVTGDKNEDKKIICPCIYHKEEVESNGRCMCGLFVK